MIAALALAVALYDVPPPGRVVSTENAYLAGHENPPWRAVLSVASAGKLESEDLYQWYLSLYTLRGSKYQLKYRSPRDGGPLWRVFLDGKKLGGAPPMREFAIVGTAQLVKPGTDELLVEWRMDSADCGSPTINAIGVSTSGRVVPLMTITNGCGLDATVIRGANDGLDMLRLTGPYFGPNSGTCCPTQQQAAATLKYRNGSWVLSPQYYQLEIDTYGR